MDTRVEFEGPDAHAAVMRAVSGRTGATRVTVTLRVQHEQKRQMCVLHAEGSATLHASSDDLAGEVAELVDETYSMHYTYRGVVVGGHVLVHALSPDPVDARELRMRLAGAATSLAADRLPHAWDTGTGACVYDWLEARYGRVRAVRVGKREYLRGAMEREVDTMRHGVSTTELDRFAEAHGLRMYAATADGRVFHARAGKSKHPPLAYAVVNGHFFPVTARSEVFHMARHGRLRERRPDDVEVDAVPSEHAAVSEATAEMLVEDARRHDIVVDTHDLSPLWARVMRARGCTLNAATRVRGATRLVRFAVDGAVLTANPGWDGVRGVAARLGVPSRPSDGIGAVARRIFEARVPLLTHLAVNVHPRASARGTPRTAFVGTTTAAPGDAVLRCFDIRRCYATQLEFNDGHRWAVAGPFDDVEAYDGGELTAGLYYVEGARGHFLCPGSGWYHHRWAQRAVARGSVVTLQRRARRSLPHDTFHACAEHVRASLDDADAKLVINSFVGGLRATERKGGRCFASTEEREARCIAGPSGVVRRLDAYAVAYTAHKPPSVAAADYSYLYDQVVEGGWVALDALCEAAERHVGCVVVALKTDAVVVRGFELDAAALGRNVREEPLAVLPSHALVARRGDAAAPVSPPRWEPVSGGAPCLYIGVAGTGKTFAAREAARAAGGRAVAVGPTVKAAVNVGGTTLHALFGITQPECFADPPSLGAIRSVARLYDCMLVDEIFMCSEWMLCALLLLRRANVTLVLAGDPNQLPPVGEMSISPTDLARSALLHELVDGRICALTEPRRNVMHDWLFGACRAFVDAPCTRGANANFVARFARCAEHDVPERNLAYLNKTCARVNAALAMRRKRGNAWLVVAASGRATVCDGVWALKRALALDPDAAVFPKGCPLLAKSGALGITRGGRVRLESLEGGVATVAGIAVDFADVPHAFDLAYCVTIHRSQCETIDEPFAIHDTKYLIRARPSTAKALLYVAASRATKSYLVKVVE